MLKILLRAFRELLTTLHKIFLEITGFFFLVIGSVIMFNGYRQIKLYLDFGEVSYFKLISTLVFGVLMLGYGIHSFVRVKGMK